MPAGTVVASGSLVSPGGQQGIPGPNAVSTDSGNQATFGSDNRIYVPNPTPVITSVRLRSFNAIGNPNFEVDQRNAGASVVNPASGTFICDRWAKTGSGTYQVSARQLPVSSVGSLVVPGTNFQISGSFLKVTLTTAQASLASGDWLAFRTIVEGTALRELINDVHSISLMVLADVAPLKFSVALRNSAANYSLTHLCTYNTANVWQLITIPNILVFPSAGNFTITPGSYGYDLSVTLAAGTNSIASSADTWVATNSLGASGMDSWVSKAVNSIFQIGFVQHEPGPNCTTPIDCLWNQNYDACLRYFGRSYEYGTATAALTSNGGLIVPQLSTVLAGGSIRFPEPMAKTPTTVTIYNHATGTAGSVRLIGGTDYSVTSVGGVGTTGFSDLNTGTMPAVVAGAAVRAHYTADTGW